MEGVVVRETDGLDEVGCDFDGIRVTDMDGIRVGAFVGINVGNIIVGEEDCGNVGAIEGLLEGLNEGDLDGTNEAVGVDVGHNVSNGEGFEIVVGVGLGRKVEWKVW